MGSVSQLVRALCWGCAFGPSVVLGCGGATPKVPEARRPSAASHGPGETASATQSVHACEPLVKTGASWEARDVVLGRYLTQDLGGGMSAAENGLKAHPADRGLTLLRSMLVATAERARVRAAEKLRGLASVWLEALPPGPTQRSEARPFAGAPKIRLEKVRESKNLITDDEDWLKRLGLAVPRRYPQPGSLAWQAGVLDGPIPEAFMHTTAHGNFDLKLKSIHDNEAHSVALYGPGPWATGATHLLVSAPGKTPRIFDASQALQASQPAFDLHDAWLAGDVLLVQMGFNGYSKEAGGRNGYVAAFDATSGRLLWNSAPLTGGLANFTVIGRSIVSGYGFTAEPDFLFVTDALTGAVDQKIPLHGAPSAILGKGDRLFVRTYDHDYEFRIDGSRAPAPAPALEPIRDDAPPQPHVEMRCRIEHALAAIDRRDRPGLAAAIEALKPLSGDRVLFAELAKADQELGRVGGIDLSTARPIAVAQAPWTYALVSAASPPPTSRPPKLVKRSAVQADPARSVNERPFREDEPFAIPPVKNGAIPLGARSDIPTQYALEDLRAILPSPDGRHLLVYGGRYLVVLRPNWSTERIFDLDLLRHPPQANPQWKAFADQDVTFAVTRADRLFVCNGGGSYAREVNGKKGFVTALDLNSGQILWRSQALVCNSELAFLGSASEWLATGYGFTDEPDFLYVLDASNGAVVSKLTLDSGPDTLRLVSGQLAVETYNKSYVFDVHF